MGLVERGGDWGGRGGGVEFRGGMGLRVFEEVLGWEGICMVVRSAQRSICTGKHAPTSIAIGNKSLWPYSSASRSSARPLRHNARQNPAKFADAKSGGHTTKSISTLSGHGSWVGANRSLQRLGHAWHGDRVAALGVGHTGGGESMVFWSSPGASSSFEASACSQVTFLPDSAAIRPRMPTMAALAQRSVSLYGLSWRMAANSRSCSDLVGIAAPPCAPRSALRASA